MPRAPLDQHGAALAVGLALSVALAASALSTMEQAVLELTLSANQQAQQQAFYAAEAGLEQALARGTYTTRSDAIAAQYADPAAREPVPRTTAGTPNTTCIPADGCEYFVRFDTRPGATIDPASADPSGALASPTRAYHFVVDSVGRSSRGARKWLQAGFYVLAPAGATDLCTPLAAHCVGTPASAPVLTYWRQQGIE